MPKRKERMAGYIRESDPSLADSATIESQAKAVRMYAEKEGYQYDTTKHEYREAISAYTVSYMERKTLLELLAAAKRREFHVLVVTEIRALSRRQVEVFIIYDLLQKYGVRLETISEKFEDSAMGRLILSLRAFVAEVERENTYMRLQRGRKDRLENGNINGHSKPAYGYVFIDTKYEAKAAYALNTAVFTVNGVEWTEVKVVEWIYDHALAGWSVRKIAYSLTEMNIPVPHSRKIMKGKPVSKVWHPSTVHTILTSRIYIGEVIANRYKNVENQKSKKRNIIKRSQDEWVFLPEGVAPAIIPAATFEKVQQQLIVNKQDALKHNDPATPKEELGILRAGYAKCGVCGRTMVVFRRGTHTRGYIDLPQYVCKQRFGDGSVLHNHMTAISVSSLDKEALAKIREVVLDPTQVREKIALRRLAPKPVVNAEDIQETIDNIQEEINNLFELARHASNDSTRERLGLLMEDLEARQREAEGLLINIDGDNEDKEKLEAEIVKFETWAKAVRVDLCNPDYVPTYEDLRLAVRILGLHAIVYPVHGEYPFRCRIDADPPEIMKHAGGIVFQSNYRLHRRR